MDTLAQTVERALGAQYDVLQLIGRGGMGAVYLARERLLERLVAVKVLPHEAATEQGGRDRFLREARTAARLSHPHIVPLYSFAEAEGTFLYVMGYVEGESLESRLAREGRIRGDEARRILSEIADALHYAHQQGVVHRDVKPDNILIENGTGRAVLTDFGIAKQGAQERTLTRTGMVVGTPHYMSPEQASADRNVDGRSDLYSLGVVAYRMLSGRLPFEGASLRDVLLAHVAREPEPLMESDGALAAAVMRCLRKEPAERWPTARALADTLRPGDRELELHDELTGLPSMGTQMLFGLFLVGVMFAMLEQYNPSPGSEVLGVLAAVSVVVPLIVGGQAVRARKFGVPWKDAVRMAFWAPSTWWGWWPAALRRPGDLWRRLPRAVRIGRTVLTAAFASFAGVLMPSLVLLLARVAGGREPRATLLEDIFMTAGPVSGILLLAGVALTVPWRRWFGLTNPVAGRLVWEPSWNNQRFWSRPDIAPLLVDDSGAAVPLHGVRDYAADIQRILAELPEPVRTAVGDAGPAARALAQGIAAMDAELAELSRHADEAERARLEKKLDGVAPHEGEPESRRQMRELIEQQLGLMHRLDVRRRELSDGRDRHLMLVRNLWQQVASLRADARRDSRGVEQITGRVRALCEEAMRQRSARAAVASTLAPTSSPTATPI